MSMNDPISRNEVELRLENVEQRLENKLDRVIAAIEILSNHTDAQIQSLRQEIRQDIAWLSKLTLGVFFLLMSILVAAAIKWMMH
jgi:tetrahydromethanopterin S-methyltransferase subunit G